jgi:hypothetical protein
MIASMGTQAPSRTSLALNGFLPEEEYINCPSCTRGRVRTRLFHHRHAQMRRRSL